MPRIHIPPIEKNSAHYLSIRHLPSLTQATTLSGVSKTHKTQKHTEFRSLSKDPEITKEHVELKIKVLHMKSVKKLLDSIIMSYIWGFKAHRILILIYKNQEKMVDLDCHAFSIATGQQILELLSTGKKATVYSSLGGFNIHS